MNAETFLHRFWANVYIHKPEHCWHWIGTRDPNGYGRIATRMNKGRPVFVSAHRFSWELANAQPIPAERFVCHSCDNPSCVNPAHLWIGTYLDNGSDCARKGHTRTAGLYIGMSVYLDGKWYSSEDLLMPRVDCHCRVPGIAYGEHDGVPHWRSDCPELDEDAQDLARRLYGEQPPVQPRAA